MRETRYRKSSKIQWSKKYLKFKGMWITYNNPEASDMYKTQKVSSKKDLELVKGYVMIVTKKSMLTSVTNASKNPLE